MLFHKPLRILFFDMGILRSISSQKWRQFLFIWLSQAGNYDHVYHSILRQKHVFINDVC